MSSRGQRLNPNVTSSGGTDFQYRQSVAPQYTAKAQAKSQLKLTAWAWRIVILLHTLWILFSGSILSPLIPLALNILILSIAEWSTIRFSSELNPTKFTLLLKPLAGIICIGAMYLNYSTPSSPTSLPVPISVSFFLFISTLFVILSGVSLERKITKLNLSK